MSRSIVDVLAAIDRHDTLDSEPIHGIHGIKSHENAKVLYKSVDAHWVTRQGMIDFFIVGLGGCLMVQGKLLCIMPIVVIIYQ